jgi:hypothetical protein
MIFAWQTALPGTCFLLAVVKELGEQRQVLLACSCEGAGRAKAGLFLMATSSYADVPTVARRRAASSCGKWNCSSGTHGCRGTFNCRPTVTSAVWCSQWLSTVWQKGIKNQVGRAQSQHFFGLLRKQRICAFLEHAPSRLSAHQIC